MSTIAKVFTVLNLVFSLVMVGTVGSILSKSEDYKAKYEAEQKTHEENLATKQKDLDAAVSDKNNFEGRNRDLTNQISDTRTELTNATATADQLRNDNNQLRNSVDAIQASLKTVETQLSDVEARNKALMDSNEQHRAIAAKAEQDKLNAQDDRARLEGDLKRANEDIAAKEAQLVALSNELGNVRAEQEALVAAGVDIAAIVGNAVPSIAGKVSAVGPGFVVLSVGENEGVKVGFPFDVYRGNDYIGRVVVDNVLPDTSTARVQLKNKSGHEFQAMDTATTRL